MLFYKPETYLIPNVSQPYIKTNNENTSFNSTAFKADFSPTRGAAGDPYIPPTKFRDIMK